ncbi:MAG: gamma-glutamyl-gamma-aminobutyrate hydrolase family protein [Planctomycetota bacterium]|nr:gamma-glutamyl-gamma-aminobutyrate hydrolase family protein [Planctomycetota bacterium]
MNPRIAVTTGLDDLDGKRRVHLPVAYADAVRAAGGEPILFCPPRQSEPLPPLEHLADGLLLTGGDDLDPAAWGQRLHPEARPVDPRRQRADLVLLASADVAGMPVLGICLGMQEMAVHRGGRIIQHLPDEPGDHLDHGRGGRPRVHPVHVEAGSLLARLLGAEVVDVNSTHHQAVGQPGRGLRVSARAPDGVIEAVEDASAGRFFLGVQWHPEEMMDRPAHAALLEGLCGAAVAWRAT